MTRVNDPTADEHRQWVANADALVVQIGGAKSKWPEWVVTARFYAALHEVQTVLVERGVTVQDHAERNTYVQNAWPNVFDPYKRLYRWSRDARYKCYVPDSRLNDSALLLAKVRMELDAAQAVGT